MNCRDGTYELQPDSIAMDVDSIAVLQSCESSDGFQELLMQIDLGNVSSTQKHSKHRFCSHFAIILLPDERIEHFGSFSLCAIPSNGLHHFTIQNHCLLLALNVTETSLPRRLHFHDSCQPVNLPSFFAFFCL